MCVMWGMSYEDAASLMAHVVLKAIAAYVLFMLKDPERDVTRGGFGSH